jgi:glutathione synthase/RimK-type ligase-like ATP-grasp enzyme
MQARIAFATCSYFPDLYSDDQVVLAPLAGLGIEVIPAVWDDPAVDWASFDLVVLRSTWDYQSRLAEFLSWTSTVPRLLNPAKLIAWNTDKAYLAELPVPVVPTTFLAPGDDQFIAPSGEFVIKPTISAGSRDTGRYRPGQADLAATHVARLHAANRVVMVQPYLSTVDTHGETAMIYFNGVFSHAVRKGALLQGPDTGPEGLAGEESVTPCAASAAERELGDALVALLDEPLYTRVDVIPGPAGGPLLIELELAEPCLYLMQDTAAPGYFARAIAARLA